MRKFSTGYTEKEVHTFAVYIRAIIISLGSLYFGYNNGSFNTTQQHIAYLNGWFSDSDVALYTALITSALSFGCLIGSLLTGKFLEITQNDYRLCLMLTDVIGILGIIEQIIDYNLGHFLLGRLLSGIAGGLNTSIVPIYLSSFSPIIMRGKTGTFVQTFAQLGSFLSLSLGVIQPIYEKIPKTVNKAAFIDLQINELSAFEKDGAWRLTLGIPIFMCLIRLFVLAFVYKQSTPVQMAQKNQLSKLKKLLDSVYHPQRSIKHYKEIINYAQECIQTTEINPPPAPEEKVDIEQKITSLPQINFDSKEEDLNVNRIRTYNREDTWNASPTNKFIRTQTELMRVSSQNEQQDSSPTLPTLVKIQKVENKVQPLANKSWKRRLWLGIVVQTASRVNGTITLTYFSNSIFASQTTDSNQIYMYLILQGFAGFFFTYISLFFIEKIGRKQSMMLSTVLLMVAQLGIAIFSMMDNFLVSFIFIIFFLFAFGIGQGGVTWPFTVELVNSEHVNICSAIRWIWVLILGITFPFMQIQIGIYGTFFIYFGATALCFIYFLKEMKETRGLTIQQVDLLYAGEPIDNITTTTTTTAANNNNKK